MVRTRFGNGVSDRPRFIANQSLGFSGEFNTLSHCFRIFLQDLGSDFGREELCHESHTHLVEDVLVYRLLSGEALLGSVVAWGRGIRQG